MDNVKVILFDCMETLIDLTELPTMRDYAFWAYDGSGAEDLWEGFEDFFKSYVSAKKALEDTLPEYKEYELLQRFELIARMNTKPGKVNTADTIARKLYKNYWNNYVSRCYVKEDVREVIIRLSGKYSLGVVSNFMVRDGIEELLEMNGLLDYFKFVVTSVREGWRKPYLLIYSTAVRKAGVDMENIIFVGDDYINDYSGPKNSGLKAVLLDRDNKHPELADKVRDFYMLENYIG